MLWYAIFLFILAKQTSRWLPSMPRSISVSTGYSIILTVKIYANATMGIHCLNFCFWYDNIVSILCFKNWKKYKWNPAWASLAHYCEHDRCTCRHVNYMTWHMVLLWLFISSRESFTRLHFQVQEHWAELIVAWNWPKITKSPLHVCGLD